MLTACKFINSLKYLQQGLQKKIKKKLNTIYLVLLMCEKDFQQVLVIRRMVVDMLLPVQIVSMPTCRETDGLAISSRNRYLSRQEREKSSAIYSALQSAVERLRNGAFTVEEIEQEGVISLTEMGMKVEYFSIRRQKDLLPVNSSDRNIVVLTAVWLGTARLIDNLKVTLD